MIDSERSFSRDGRFVRKIEATGDFLTRMEERLKEFGIDEEGVKEILRLAHGALFESTVNTTLSATEVFGKIAENAGDDWQEIVELTYVPQFGSMTNSDIAERLRADHPELDVKLDTGNFVHSPVKVRKRTIVT